MMENDFYKRNVTELRGQKALGLGALFAHAGPYAVIDARTIFDYLSRHDSVPADYKAMTPELVYEKLEALNNAGLVQRFKDSYVMAFRQVVDAMREEITHINERRAIRGLPAITDMLDGFPRFRMAYA